MVIFNSYVKLPEGKYALSQGILGFPSQRNQLQPAFSNMEGMASVIRSHVGLTDTYPTWPDRPIPIMSFRAGGFTLWWTNIAIENGHL